ncbi:hypothetical protein BJX99DRAFT_265797 [Aspergillus californicus]
MAEDKKPIVEASLGKQETLLPWLKTQNLTITTNEKKFKVHKLVVCSQSGYFARMFNGNWLETSTSTIDLKEDDPRFVQTMIEFVHGSRYDSTKHGLTSSLMFHISAYQIADKYEVPKPKNYSKDKLGSLVEFFLGPG